MKYSFIKTPYSQTAPRLYRGVSVQRAGRIGLPKRFITAHGVHGGMRARMYWDAKNRTIAFALTEGSDEVEPQICFAWRFGACIRASAFFKFNRIDVRSYVGRYNYAVVEAVEVGVIDGPKQVFLVDPRAPMRSSGERPQNQATGCLSTGMCWASGSRRTTTHNQRAWRTDDADAPAPCG